MGQLRDYLNAEMDELYAALMRSWQIALDEWLPALGTELGSFNSYPHLRNVENYLDRFIGEGAEKLRVDLTPTEVYVLLASVLLHDIGRIIPKPPLSKTLPEKSHAALSREIITQHRGDLGIPSQELANVIGLICAYHAPSNDDERARLAAELQTVAIDPYGEIRQRLLATLLTLADYLDSAFTRVIPHYLIRSEHSKIIGAFRSIVTGVSIDHEAHLIRTVMASNIEAYSGAEDALTVTINDKRLDELARIFHIAVDDCKVLVTEFKKERSPKTPGMPIVEAAEMFRTLLREYNSTPGTEVETLL